jgi:Leucine-rich repeat (LRR) protein
MKNQYRMQYRPLAFLALLLALGLLLPAQLRAQSPFKLYQPKYDCSTGAIAFDTSGGDGTPVTFSAPGISRSTVTSMTGTVEQGLRNDPKSITIQGTQSGKTATFTFDLKAYCNSLNTKQPDYDPLADFYNSTNGANWTNKANWLTGNNPCSWYGVSCGENGRVAKLGLVNNNLNGSMPASIGNLAQLETLRLLQNSLLKGDIPASLGNLKQLKNIFLVSNALSGEIPAALGNLTQLQTLNLSFNQLTGLIPSSLGNLTQLQELRLVGNQLTGSIPASLGNLSQLKSLFLFSNQLSGCLAPALSALCGKNVQIYSNPNLSGGGDWTGFCTYKYGACTTTGPLTMSQPTYDCATGIITFNTSGGDGTTITYQAPGVVRASVTSPTGTIEQGLRNDPKPITITATQSGKTASYTFDFKAFCNALNANPDLQPLIDLYNATSGPGWTNKTNWLTGSNPCNWYGITCNGNARVSSVFLPSNSLNGSIPASLGNLSQLQYLYLNANQLKGSIPASLGNLSQLQTLFLPDNQLNGSIPATLGSLSQLKEFYLNNNRLTGTIPGNLGNLSKLQYLWLSINQLTGTIPASLGNLTQLINLDLGYNQLTGSIPAELGNLASLQAFTLYGNQLSGPIPTSLGNLSQLSTLYFTNNQLTGSIPASLGNLSSLTFLGLDNNKLSGSIPASLGKLSKVSLFGLSNNQLTGSIPAELGNLSNLTGLYLSNNQLTGSVPASLADLTKLNGLDLSYNQLSGCLPSALSSLCGKSVSLYGNTGLPNGGDFFAFCNNRTGSCDNPLVLTAPTYNCATGAITFNTTGGDFTPITFQAPGIIRSSPTSSTGIVEAGLRGDPKVLTITAIQSGKTVSINFDFGAFCRNASPDYGPLVDLYNATKGDSWFYKTNWLTGNNPCNWSGVSCNSAGRVYYLYLGYNNLNGTLPASLGNLSQLQTFNLNSNNLTGAIPTSLGNLTNLTTLDMDYCKLSGSIPASLGNLSKLQYFYLYHNQLTGEIPSSLGNLGNLFTMHLNNNQLSGSIPASLGNLSKLQSLYLYNNHLTGEIPASLGSLPSVYDLYLSGNKLTGAIPASLGNLSRVYTINLSDNQLTGSVPASFANLSQNYVSIYLSSNKLSGCLPSVLSKLCGRSYLDLSNNPGLPGGGNFSAFCSTGTGACLPEPLVLTTPTYVCATGAITFNTTGGDGSPITFQAPGIIRSAPTSSTGVVEQGLRNDPKVLTITAIQNGKTASINFDFAAYCRSLNAVGEPGTRLSVEVLGNPVREQVQVLIRGAEGRSVQLRLTDVTGRVLETRLVEAAGAAEEQTFRLLPTQAPGVLLLQAATTQQTQTVKVVKQ